MEAYSDSDYAGCYHTSRSTSGYVFTLHGAPVAWSSTRQSVVATSTTQAEYIGMSNAGDEAVHLRNLLTELGIPQTEPTFIYEDNFGAICLAEDPINHKKTKHYRVKWHHIRELVTDGTILFFQVSTHDNIADIFTKALPRPTFQKFVRLLGFTH